MVFSSHFVPFVNAMGDSNGTAAVADNLKSQSRELTLLDARLDRLRLDRLPPPLFPVPASEYSDVKEKSPLDRSLSIMMNRREPRWPRLVAESGTPRLQDKPTTMKFVYMGDRGKVTQIERKAKPRWRDVDMESEVRRELSYRYFGGIWRRHWTVVSAVKSLKVEAQELTWHMSHTVCLPSNRGDVLAVKPIQAGTRFIWPEVITDWADLSVLERILECHDWHLNPGCLDSSTTRQPRYTLIYRAIITYMANQQNFSLAPSIRQANSRHLSNRDTHTHTHTL